MESSTGVRRRRATNSETSGQTMVQNGGGGENEAARQSDTSSRPMLGVMAAAFKNSKGTELQQVVYALVKKAGLRVESETTKDKEFTVLKITAPFRLMVKTAEELGLRKKDRDGRVRTFYAGSVKDFTLQESPESLFSQSEQLLLIDYVLDTIKPDKSRFDDVKGNESLLGWCKRQNYLEDCFPLHDEKAAQEILDEFSFKSPLLDVAGIEKIQNYFGDQVALYFAFLSFYTRSLVTYGLASVVISLFAYFRPAATPLLMFAFTLFGAIWAATFTTFWKRHNIELVYMWKNVIMGDPSDESYLSISQKEDVRTEFYGDEVDHRITGEKIVIYPKTKKWSKYAVSTLFIMVSIVISSRVMLWSLDFEDVMKLWIIEQAPKHSWSRPYIVSGLILNQLPLVVYLACLNIAGMVYGKLATKLTEWENHKYQSTFENALVLKLVLFQALNMNFSYLHVAFVRRDYTRLYTAIRTVLGVELLIGNIRETFLPLYMARRKKKAKEAEATAKKKEEDPDADEKECLAAAADLNDPLTDQLDMEPYNGVFEDYFELVRQFSQITLFAAAFPTGALLAAANNFGELYSDCFKLVKATRRATPRRATNIGAWLSAFEIISTVSVMTNLGILTLTAKYAGKVVGKHLQTTHEYFWMIAIEHVLIVLRYLFGAVFEGIPSWVRDHRAKERWQMSKQKTNNEVLTESRKVEPMESEIN
eukprot:Plantae.Rhodophyta-Hildenbrandia_rubra.ctg4230.p1 GENE.Plantae.Rhodophyta-Hildenbrandia_rubra.ctg4230~~Plantae.Rhodophyta-Hildenbrandia_rubra.ctg4230.p1  ORF type:complete len:705 (+),score=118.44 Plantae.Rhodophyta-Hildenbrandia_rubra.ctg4230:2675-4789(+)